MKTIYPITKEIEYAKFALWFFIFSYPRNILYINEIKRLNILTIDLLNVSFFTFLNILKNIRA